MKNVVQTLCRAVLGLALTVGCNLARSADTSFAFTTLAGSTNSGSANGPGGAAQFKRPSGVAVDGAGNLYVADTANQIVRKITSAGDVTTLAGTAAAFGGFANGTGAAARFNSPSSVAVDVAGNVYVADTVNQAIRQVTPAGEVTTIAGRLGPAGTNDGPGTVATFNYPYGVAVDAATNVYVADAYNHAIRKVAKVGGEWVVTTMAGLPQNSGFADGAGSEARFAFPQSVAVDGAGNVYVSDTSNNTIRKVTPAGVVTTLAGLASSQGGSADGAGTNAAFRLPKGLAVDGAGNVYVADQDNHALRKLTPAGVVTTIGGNTSITNENGRPVGGYADGTGGGARFNGPSGVAVDGAGNLHVADQLNHMIRKGTAGSLPPEIVFSNPGFATGSGGFGVDLTGPLGQAVIVDGSTDLVNWLPIVTNVTGGVFNFIDAPGGGYPTRFYRARTP